MPLGQLGAGIGMGEGNYMNARLPFQVAGGGTGIGQPMASLSGSIPGYQAGMPYGAGAPFNQPQGGMAATFNPNQAAPGQPMAMLSGSIPGYQGGMPYGAGAAFNLPAQYANGRMSTAGMNPGANALYPQFGQPQQQMSMQPQQMMTPGGGGTNPYDFNSMLASIFGATQQPSLPAMPQQAMTPGAPQQAMTPGPEQQQQMMTPGPQSQQMMTPPTGMPQGMPGPLNTPDMGQQMMTPGPQGPPQQPLAPFQGPRPGQVGFGGIGASNYPGAMPQGMLNNPAVQQAMATGGPWGGAMNMNYMAGRPLLPPAGQGGGLAALLAGRGGLPGLLGGGRAGLPFSPGPVAAPPMPALPAKAGFTSQQDRMRPARPQRQGPGSGGGR